MNYREFLERKIDIAPMSGIEIDPSEVNPVLKDHQRVSVLWALRGGRRGKGVELNPDYFRDGVGYLESADAERDAPTLFDLLENGA